MDKYFSLAKNTLLYTASNFISKFIIFILLPLYTFYLTTSEFGYYDLVMSVANILTPLITLQIIDGMYRFVVENKTDYERIYSNTIVLILANSLIFTSIGFLITGFYKINYGSVIIIQTIFSILLLYWQQCARGLAKNHIFAYSGVLYSTLIGLLSFFTIVFLKMKIEGLFYSNILAAVVTIVLIELKLRLLTRLKIRYFKKELIKRLLIYSVPLIPNAFSWWIINASNRIIISKFMGFEANGVFAVAVRIPSIIVFLNGIIYLAWQESSLKEYESEDKDSFYSNVFNFLIKVQLSVLIVLISFTKFYYDFFIHSSYSSSSAYIPFLYIGAIFSGFSSFYGVGYLGAKETRGIFYTTAVGAILNIIINLALIRHIGLYAIALSYMLSFLLIWILRIYQTQKFFKIKIKFKPFLLLISIMTIYVAAYYANIFILDVVMALISPVVFVAFNFTNFNKILNLLIKKRIQ